MEIHSSVNLGPRVQVAPRGGSRTKQSFFEESEITNIMARYVKTGIVDHLARYGGEYGFATSVDFHSAMNVVTKADQMFADLPAEIRRRFGGDPGDFLEFVQNPENQEEMISLGLATRVKGIEPGASEAVPEAEAAPITPDVAPDLSPPEAGSEAP